MEKREDVFQIISVFQCLEKGGVVFPKLHRADTNQRTGPARDPRIGLALALVFGLLIVVPFDDYSPSNHVKVNPGFNFSM